VPPRSPVAALVLADAEEALLRLRAAAAGVPGRSAWSAGSLPVSDAVRALEESLLAVQATLAGADAQTALAALGERAAEIAARLARIGAVDELEGARTVEWSASGFTLSLMPFDISQRFRALLESRSAAWIFTSATLSLGADFGHFTGRLGLADADTLQIESPFDHERQSLLYLPPGLPEPASSGYVAAVIDTAEPLIRAAGGGAFVLFTSHRALAQGAAPLRARWSPAQPCRLLVQGKHRARRMLEEFQLPTVTRASGHDELLGGRRCEGEGTAPVVIEKLRPRLPDDPLVRRASNT
jgi:ATP-dependent DNA helicase DinG